MQNIPHPLVGTPRGDLGASHSMVALLERAKVGKPSNRIEFVDELRGFAVIAMFCWHSLDAWLAPSRRSGTGWELLHLLGGMAAPLFLILAGVSVGLSVARATQRNDLRSTRTRLVLRGATIVLLGYALRIGLWCIDGGALLRSGMVLAWGPLLLGLTLAIAALKHWLYRRTRAWVLAGASALVWMVGVLVLNEVSPHSANGLFRVDVLQAIGVSIMIAACCVRVDRRGVATLVLLTFLIVSLGPSLRQVVPHILSAGVPPVIVGYLAKWASSGQPIAMFPLFPWLSYALTGAVLGIWLHATFRSRSEIVEHEATPGKEHRVAQRMFALGAFGALMAMCSSEGLPAVHRLTHAHSFVIDGVRLGYRLGLSLVCVSLFSLAKTYVFQGRASLLSTFGCTSLLMYCAHLPLVFGVASRSIKRSLDYGQLAAALCLLTLAMWVLAKLRLKHLGKAASLLMSPVAAISK